MSGDDVALAWALGGLVGTVISVLLGWSIGKQRGRAGDGAALGLLGPVGWIIAALLPEEGRRCPECRSVVPPDARRCKHCGVSFQLEIVAREPVPDAAHLRQLLDRRGSGTWYVITEGKPTQGPFSVEQLRLLYRSGKLAANAVCTRSGEDKRVPVSEVV